MFLDTQHLEILPKGAKIAISMWKICEECVKSMLESVKEGVKVCESITNDFQVLVDAFRHPACQNWLKNGQNNQECLKSVWRVCESV